MKKLLVRFICALVPSTGFQDYIVRKFIRNKGRVRRTDSCFYKNNKIVVVSANGARREIKSFRDITFQGDNNYVELHEPIKNIHLKARLMSNAEIIIHSSDRNVILSVSQSVYSPNKTRLVVGPNFWSGDFIGIEFQNNANVIIGAGCMVSAGVILRTTDYHTIIKQGTHTVINDNKDIIIGNRVWIGANAMILKGSVLPDNSVIGAQSVVAGKFDESNVAIAGVPARIVKRGIDWDRRDISTYKRENK